MAKPRARRRLYGREADLAGVKQGGSDPDGRTYKTPSQPKAAVAKARVRAAHKARVEGMRADTRTRAAGMAAERAAKSKALSVAKGRVPPRVAPSGGGHSGPSINPVTPRPARGPSIGKGPIKQPTPLKRRPGGRVTTGIAGAMRGGADDDKYSGTVSSR